MANIRRVSVDPGETHDLSEEKAQILKELLADWDDYVVSTGTVWGYDTVPVNENNRSLKPDEPIVGDE